MIKNNVIYEKNIIIKVCRKERKKEITMNNECYAPYIVKELSMINVS